MTGKIREAGIPEFLDGLAQMIANEVLAKMRSENGGTEEPATRRRQSGKRKSGTSTEET
jgi:hypothetical protein